MSWQCPRDGWRNTGGTCIVCGGPPFTQALVLTGGGLVIALTTRSRVFGSRDWPAVDAGLSRQHLRCFFAIDEGRWFAANVSPGADVWLNGVPLTAGDRHALRDGDALQLGPSLLLRVGMRNIGSGSY